VANTSRAETLVNRVIARTGGEHVVKLARAVCLAVLVEPGLLRRARAHLVPGADVGTESDLWFSPLVLTRNPTGIVLDPDVVTLLRQQLATGADGPEFADRAHDLVAWLHAGYPPAVRLEEEVVWETVRHGNAALSRVEARLRKAVKAMATDPDGGRDVARWVAQAWPRLPDTATRTDAAHLLAVGAALRLGTAAGVASFGKQKMPASLGWLTPSSPGVPILLGVELATDGLHFVEPATDGLILEMPRTSPLVLEIGWHDGATSHHEVMTVAPGTDIMLGSVVSQVTLRTLTGQRYIIEPEVVDRPDQAAADASTEAPAPPERAPRWVDGCPYRGLLPFGEADAEVFYGRERLTAELIEKLTALMNRGGLVVVTGASGSGKSSLLRAGLVPGLARGMQVKGSEYWPRIVITPGSSPLSELAVHLAVLSDSDAAGILAGLTQDPAQAHLIVRQAVIADAARRAGGQSVSAGDDARLVLIVDQFEQTFTLTSGNEVERRAFVTALCAAAGNPPGPPAASPALVIIAVRGDFLRRCAADPELARELEKGLFAVGPMTQSELRSAITGPADAAALRIDPELVDTILRDLNVTDGDDTIGALPLLSQAMLLTWERREGNRLTSHVYAETGGVSHAVQTSVHAVYDSLPAELRALALELLRSMTVVERDGRPTRHPVNRAGLYADHANADQPKVDMILEALTAQRLLILNDDTVQIAHDAVLAAWPGLRR
jgi:hypothetical protein